jgi:hypothetical protein
MALLLVVVEPPLPLAVLRPQPALMEPWPPVLPLPLMVLGGSAQVLASCLDAYGLDASQVGPLT